MAKKGTLEIGVEHEVVVLLGDVPERRVLFHTGVVDEEIELAQLRHAVGDELVHRSDISQIAADADRTPAQGFDLCFHGVGGFRVGMIVHHDIRAILRETKRDARADTPGCCR